MRPTLACSTSTPPAPRPAPSTILLKDGPFTVAHHHCLPGDERWHTENRVVTGHIVVFPWAPVALQPVGADRVLADPTCVLFWNQGEAFRRQLLSERGDESALFAVDTSVALDIIAECDPSVRERPDAPFVVRRAPSDPRSFMTQAAIVRAAMSGQAPDPVEWQEATLALVRHSIRSAYATSVAQGRRRPTARRRMQLEAVEQTRAFLASNWSRSLSLMDIAERIGFSPYHLCRVFRAGTGRSLHEYLTQLRLRAALEAIAGGPPGVLTHVAETCGFANHSHLTRAFRAAFGLTPSTARRLIDQGRLTELRGTLGIV
jgi:AraC-like DNA-binding protein